MAPYEVRGITFVALVPHMDAGDRNAWSGDQDERPLSELGWRQAEAMAETFMNEYVIRGLFASPALRARQTLEPISKKLGIPIQIAAGLAEKQLGEDRVAMAERGDRAVEAMSRTIEDGVVVACSHGDIIPAMVELAAPRCGLLVPQLKHRGQWFVFAYTPSMNVPLVTHHEGGWRDGGHIVVQVDLPNPPKHPLI